jgi:hypothetical protein
MLRFFLFVIGVMVTSASAAEDISPCPFSTVPIQIMIPGHSSGIKLSATEIPDVLPHFRTLVEAVTGRINSWQARNNFCIDGAKDIGSGQRSLLQFVYWRLPMSREYRIPAMPSTGYGDTLCRISSPWIDLAVERKPVPQIVGIIRWNERQLLADQAVLAGAKNVPPGMAMPLNADELSHFENEVRRKTAVKPVEARVPPDILWLLRSLVGTEDWTDINHPTRSSMYGVTKKGAEGYTKLVLALIDRCFASDGTNVNYISIVDVADPVLLEQYKITQRLY